MSESSPIESVSHTPAPQDRRCRYWAKMFAAEQALPLPGDVHGANDLPGAYLHAGDEIELFDGDWFFDGEAVSHRKQRGWTYYCGDVRGGELKLSSTRFKNPDVKVFLRERGERELLRGAGDVAAMVRYVHAVRLGYREWFAERKAAAAQ